MLYQAISEHREHLFQSGREELVRREELRVRNQLVDLLKEGLLETALQRMGGLEG